MKKGRNAAEILDSNDEFDTIEPLDDERQEKTLILKAAPPSIKAQLIAHGAIEIRCGRCNQIKPLAKAEESDEGWICGDCVREIMQKLKRSGQRRK
jgi:hypothetical protein